MDLLSNDYCYSIKNKKEKNLRCVNKCKNGEKLCGVHINSKNIIFYINKNNKNKENKEDTKDTEDTKYTEGIEDKEEKHICREIYSKEELFDKISNDLYLSIYSIRNSIKQCDLKSVINTKQTKVSLIKDLKALIEKNRYYLNNIHNIIKIQSIFRSWLIYRKKLCINDSDILSFIDKYEIPNKYFYSFYDKVSGKKYAYDIRTILEIINSEYKNCPYTFREFTNDEINKIIAHKNKLLLNNININIQKFELSKEEQIDMKIKDTFHKINMLDNYTNYEWFKNLNTHDLYTLYIKTEDIWNYRSNMSIESKSKIVKYGIAFNIHSTLLKTYNKIKLQNIILDEYNRLISEGINRDEKKLGAILILTGLVEVSFDAANALPHLIQI